MTVASSANQTLDQRRARHAWEAVSAIKNGSGPKAFRGQAKKLPMRIMAAGLGHALAFVKEKGNTPDLLTAIGDWILDKRCNPRSTAPRPDDDTLIMAIITKDALFLRRAAEETLAYLLWLNRFAAVELPEADDDD
jgi:CRISPR-associated protein Cmr5